MSRLQMQPVIAVPSTRGPEAVESAAEPATWTLVVNGALYQAGWLACVFGAAGGWPELGASLALALIGTHLWLAEERRREALLVGAAGLLGLLLDTLQLRLGVFSYPSGTPVAGLAPPFIVVLWMQFGTLFHYCFRWLSGRYLLGAALGLVGGPLSFLAGERIGAISFSPPRAASFALLGLVWALALPLLTWIADRLRPATGASGYRLPG